MSRQYFGTDGVRGRVGDTPITPDFVMRLGYAAGKVLVSNQKLRGEHPAVLIGKDTRISGYMLESALEAGLTAAGVDVRLTGPIPTPAVAYLTRALRLQAGIVISASHNPFEDNGIKFFSADGQKLPDDVEAAIERELETPLKTMPSAQLGKVKRVDDAAGRYIEFCKGTFPFDLDLRGLRIVVDCANGATYHVAPPVFHELGAEVIPIGVEPNGLNINQDCGATSTQAMRDAVLRHHAHLGIALDGDGDRLIMADEKGGIFDGDHLIYIIAGDRQETRYLKGGVVGTLMTNLGMEHALTRLNIPFDRAQVGDRYVLERLQEKGWQVGGETSGHILCLDRHTTGDGIISALQVLRALVGRAMTLSEASRDLRLYPQILVNVRTPNRGFDFRSDPVIQAKVREAESDLNASGRVLLRASGTEPLIRIMVEGEDRAKVEHWAHAIADAVRAAVD
jgi:phosphoglucosamine mutase